MNSCESMGIFGNFAKLSLPGKQGTDGLHPAQAQRSQMHRRRSAAVSRSERDQPQHVACNRRVHRQFAARPFHPSYGFRLSHSHRITPPQNLNLGRGSNCTIFAIFLQKTRVGRGAPGKNSLKITITAWILTITGATKNVAG